MSDGTDAEAPDERPFTYDEIADGYAAMVDTTPWNALYERPATTALLPEDLAGLRVLDVGCGSGWYAELLLARGASVVGIDITARMIELTRERLGERVELYQANAAEPLDFPDESFDMIVAPLMMHYILDWERTFREFHRVLRPGGRFLFSTHHPSYDAKRIADGGYFITEQIEERWNVGTVRFYHRPLVEITEPLANAGFLIERMVEPRTSEEIRRADERAHERLSRLPAFLVIRAKRIEKYEG